MIDTKAGRGALKAAIKVAGGQSALARSIRRGQGRIADWLKTGRVPGEACGPIEDATGIPRWQIRPDLFQAPNT